MKIYFLNGPRLLRAILAGSDSVINKTEYLNKINVFPVADSDTGTNMAITLQSINRALANGSPGSIQDVGMLIADSALMGAQGNSGVILAQFFYGFAEHLNGKSKIKVKTFSKAVNSALKSSCEALSNPVEGTILDVMSAWAKAIEIASVRTQDFEELIKSSMEASRHALAETPKKMKLLADSGVVDAGAQGFVYFIEGINRYISSGTIEPPPTEFADIDISHPNIKMAPENLKFQYCTECIIIGTSMNRNDIKDELIKIGDSLIVAGSKEKIKIHIHSNEPDQVFEHLFKYGTVSNKKVDDMRAQHVAQFEIIKTNDIAIVTDSSCDLPHAVLEELNVNVVSLRINFGTESYLDKSTMTTGEFYNMFEMADTPPTTSQPTPADFKKVYENVSKSSKQIVSIHLSGSASGTLQSAQAVSRNIQDTAVTTIDSTSASIGLGLLVRYAAELLRDGKSYDEIIRLTKKMVPNTKIFVGISDVGNLIRGGRIPISKGIISRMLNLRPIITFDEKGKGISIANSFGNKGILSKVFSLITKHSENYDNLRFAVVHTRSSKQAKKLEGKLKAHFNTEDIYMIEASPTLGVHAGMGMLGAAFIGDPKT